MAREKRLQAYVDVDSIGRNESELDSLTIGDFVGRLDRDEEDPFVTPWKRHHDSAFRTLLAN
jgi:hypothetical protein